MSTRVIANLADAADPEDELAAGEPSMTTMAATKATTTASRDKRDMLFPPSVNDPAILERITLGS